ncbi:MAG: hypothetical protein P4L84_04160 [Isosphaeraceae bacterium]|nr:hypothetical protein [Isosphaeraceae bacterium]
MRKAFVWLGLLMSGAPSSFSWADSYGPFRNFRQPDATGRFYVVVKKNSGPQDPGAGTPVTFQFAERAPGSVPVVPAKDGGRGPNVIPNPGVVVRKGDLLLGSGSLKRCPATISISSDGWGFVGLGVRGYNYGDVHSIDALVIVSRDGQVRHRKAMIDLFSEDDIRHFVRTAGGIHWLGGGWIDDTRKQAIIVGSRQWLEMKPLPRLFRVVNLNTGEVGNGSAKLVLAALSDTNRGALDDALDLVGELGLAEAKPDLARILSDDEFPIVSRLRSAVALAALGDRRGGGLMKQIALVNSPGQRYAIEHLPLVIGDEAPLVLCDVVRRFGTTWSETAWQAMHEVRREAAVAPLIQLLRENAGPTATDFAIGSLEIMGREAEPAIPDLIELLKREPRTPDPAWTQQLVAMVLGHIGPDAKAALPALIHLAEKHAPEEWAKVKDTQPEIRKAVRKNALGEQAYSDDAFVDAILKIRAK